MTIFFFLNFIYYLVSAACAMADLDSDELIITGGVDIKKRVSVYNKDGHQRDLADLNQGRESHACSIFEGSNGDGKVNFIN